MGPFFCPSRRSETCSRVIRIDADEMGVEGRVIDFRERNTIRNDWLPEPLIFVSNDMGGIEQQRFRQPGQSAATIVSSDYGLAERRLVQPLLDGAQGVTPFERGLPRGQCSLIGWGERHPRFQCLLIPPGDKGRQNGLISTGRDPEEIDDGYLVLIRFSKPTVVGCIRILAHEGVVNRLIALEDLAITARWSSYQTLPPGFGNTVLIDSRNRICRGLKIPRRGFMTGMRSSSKENPDVNSVAVR